MEGPHPTVLESNSDEELLIAAARAGDRDALRNLCASHLPQLWDLTARCTLDDATAFSVTREVFSRVEEALESRPAGESFQVMLYRLAVRQLAFGERLTDEMTRIRGYHDVDPAIVIQQLLLVPIPDDVAAALLGSPNVVANSQPVRRVATAAGVTVLGVLAAAGSLRAFSGEVPVSVLSSQQGRVLIAEETSTTTSIVLDDSGPNPTVTLATPATVIGPTSVQAPTTTVVGAPSSSGAPTTTRQATLPRIVPTTTSVKSPGTTTPKTTTTPTTSAPRTTTTGSPGPTSPTTTSPTTTSPTTTTTSTPATTIPDSTTTSP